MSRKSILVHFCISIALLLIPSATKLVAATKYWIGPNLGYFSSNANWSLSSGGSNDTTAPGASDVAVFDGADTSSCYFGSGSASVQGIDIQSGYSGVVSVDPSASSPSLTVGSSGFNQSAGTFTGTGFTSLDANGSTTLTSGTLTLPTSTTSISGNLTISGGTFLHGTGTILLDANGNRTHSIGNAALYNVTYTDQTDTSYTNTVSGTMTILGNLSITRAYILSGGVMAVSGNLSFSDLANSGSITIVASGTSDQILSGSASGADTPHLGVNKSAGIVFVRSVLDQTSSDFTVTTGTVDFGTSTIALRHFLQTNGTTLGSSSASMVWNGSTTINGGLFTAPSGTMDIYGNFTVASSVGFSHGSGLIELVSNGNRTINTASATLNNLVLLAGANTLTFSGVTDVDGNFSITTASGLNGGSLTVAGNIALTDISHSGTLTIIADGAGTQIMTAATNGDLSEDFIINKPSGTLTVRGTFGDGGNWSFVTGTVDLATSSVAWTNFTQTNGSFLGSSSTITSTGSTTVNGGLFTAPTGTMTISGNITIGNDVVFSHGTGTITLSAGAARTISVGTAKFYNFTINDSGAFSHTVSGTLDIDGAYTISSLGSVTGTLVISGNINSSDAAVGGGGSITLDGSSDQTIGGTGDIGDAHFIINKSGGVVTLSAGKTFNGTGQDLTVTSGTLDLATYDLTVSDVVTVSSTGILKLSGNQTVSRTSLAFHPSSTIIYTGTSTYTNLKLGTNYGNLIVSSTAQGSFSTSSVINVSSTLTVSSGTLSLIGTATNTIVGNAVIDSNGFLFSSSSLWIQGGSVTGNGAITFTNNTLTLQGDGNFGGNNTWRFTNLTFGTGTIVATTTGTGSGTIRVNNRTIKSNHGLVEGPLSWISGIQFTTTTSSGLESSSTISIEIFLPTTSTQASTVFYNATSGTATLNSDYSFVSGTATIAASNTTTTLNATTTDDGEYEGNETIVFNLSNPTNATLGTNANHTYTILDNDTLPTVFFTSSTFSQNESTTTATLILQLSATSSATSTLTFSTSGTATYTTDYTLSTTTATISAGNTTTSISLTITNDAFDELDETVILTITTSTNSILGSTSTLTYTITDDDATPTISFSLATSSVVESTATATIIIALSASSSFITTVQYSVQASSTATGSGTDYTLTNGTSTIQAGNTTTSIQVSIINDSDVEASEILVLRLSNPASSTLGSVTDHVLTITDNDVANTTSTPVSAPSNPPSGGGGSQSSASQSGQVSGTNPPQELSGFGIFINNNANTTPTTTVILSFNAPAGTNGIEISENVNFMTSTTIFIPYVSSHAYTFRIRNEGLRTVYARFRNPLLSTSYSQTVSDSILYLPKTEERVCPIPTRFFFTRVLGSGSEGSDVAALNAFLSENDFPVNQGSVFTTSTSRALRFFQETYKEKILTPFDRAQGTGYLDAPSRAFINAMRNETAPLFNCPTVTKDMITPPLFTSTTIISTDNSATISFITDKPGSTRLDYDVMVAPLRYQTEEKDLGAGVNLHSVQLDNLKSCTVYRIRTRSRSFYGFERVSSFSRVVTKGCTGNADIVRVTSTLVQPNQDISLMLYTTSSNTGGVEIKIPSGAVSSPTVFQIIQLATQKFIQAAPLPENSMRIGAHTYHIKAFSSPTSLVQKFNKDISVRAFSDFLETRGMNKRVPTIFRKTQPKSWQELSNCFMPNPYSTTCTTNQFSDFVFAGIAKNQSTSTTGISGERPSEEVDYLYSEYDDLLLNGLEEFDSSLKYVMNPDDFNLVIEGGSRRTSVPNLSIEFSYPDSAWHVEISESLLYFLKREVLEPFMNYTLKDSTPGEKFIYARFYNELQQPLATISRQITLSEARREEMPVLSDKPKPNLPAFAKTLRLGTVGVDVKNLQIFLNNFGFPIALSGPGSIGQETEKFGTATQKALIKFQDAYKEKLGITRGTGVMGPATISLINSLLGPTEVLKTKSQINQSISQNLGLGIVHPEVKVLQKILNTLGFPIALSGPGSIGQETEKFGLLTKKAVERFQIKYGIASESDVAFGYVGKKTREKLLELSK